MTDELRNVDEMTFKEASVELERIVRSLEQGDLELEESLERYGRGVALLASLRERLSGAEQRVQELVDQAEAPAATFDTTSAPSTAYIDE
ncbi:MAG: exodeoxyribonuclease VII small subunit [Acidobacteriota bacterium]|nr:exodeoxyribonuclease VII small subunit [Acidobacteriota bacterium]